VDDVGGTVWQALAELGIAAPPIDVMAAAQYFGLVVVFATLTAAPGFICRHRGRFLVFVNRRNPPTRQRSTIAHEIGEALYWQGGGPIRAEETHQPLSPWEQRMNRFAAELLMPAPMLTSAIAALPPVAPRGRYLGLDLLCERFDVSRSAMVRRLDAWHEEGPVC
jgi:Zn-dependent peptidase ImmA (M78 family)